MSAFTQLCFLFAALEINKALLAALSHRQMTPTHTSVFMFSSALSPAICPCCRHKAGLRKVIMANFKIELQNILLYIEHTLCTNL